MITMLMKPVKKDLKHLETGPTVRFYQTITEGSWALLTFGHSPSML
jgi:hypothetical protein